jgi:hypothetical protein
MKLDLGYVSVPDQVYWTPDETTTFINELHDAVADLLEDTLTVPAGGSAPLPGTTEASRLLFRDLMAFNEEWNAWYISWRDSWTGSWTGGDARTARRFAARYNDLWERSKDMGIPVRRPRVETESYPWWFWGALGVGGLLALGWVLHSVAKFAAPTQRIEVTQLSPPSRMPMLVPSTSRTVQGLRARRPARRSGR